MDRDVADILDRHSIAQLKAERIGTKENIKEFKAQIEQKKEVIAETIDYHSHNTNRLNEKVLTDMLLDLREIKEDLKELKGNE